MSQAGLNNIPENEPGYLETLTGNSGGAVGPDGSDNINVVGNISQGIDIVGSPSTNTLTAAFSSSTNQLFAFLSTLNIGTASPSLSYAMNLQKSTNGPIGFSVYNSNTGSQAEAQIRYQTAGGGDVATFLNNTLHSWTWQYGMDGADSGAFKISGPLGFGEGQDYFRVDQSTGVITFNESYAFPTAQGTSGQVLTATGSGTLVFSTPASISNYAVVTTTTQGLVPNYGFCANSGSQISFLLPVSAVVGTVMEIDGLGAGGWIINQNANQLLHYGSSVTTTGISGSLASTNRYDSVTFRCVVANTTWVVIASQGNLTVT